MKTGQEKSGKVRSGQDRSGKDRSGKDRSEEDRSSKDRPRKVGVDQDMQKVYFCPGTNFWLKNVRTIYLKMFFKSRVSRVNDRVFYA